MKHWLANIQFLGQQLTVSNICREFSDTQMKRKASAAAEQYYRRNPLPAQPGASSSSAGKLASILNFHSMHPCHLGAPLQVGCPFPL